MRSIAHPQRAGSPFPPRQIANVFPSTMRPEDAQRLLGRYADHGDAVMAAVPPHYRDAILAQLRRIALPTRELGR